VRKLKNSILQYNESSLMNFLFRGQSWIIRQQPRKFYEQSTSFLFSSCLVVNFGGVCVQTCIGFTCRYQPTSTVRLIICGMK
jgi:hypothetical protein